ncbi:MAG: glycosyltransferase family 4 protein [Acidimicrobiales bacterium]
MRVLVLTNMYPPHAYGGYEQSCRDVVEYWRSAGHQVLVLTGRITVPGVAVIHEDPNQVRRELWLNWEDHEIVNPHLHQRLTRELTNRRSLDRAVQEFRPDVVSAWAMGAMSLGLLTSVARRGIPVVSVICDEWPLYGPLVDAWLRPFAARPRLGRLIGVLTGLETTLPDLDRIGPACFVSEFLRRTVRARSPWCFPDSTVVYSGIQSGEFPARRRAAPRWGWRLLCVGRIDPRKGVDTAIRALALCPPEAVLQVIGRGDDRHLRALGDLASELGLSDRVRFGTAERSELAGIYAAADALVFPPTWEEPFGLVPVEAMSCGTPVVATTVGGAAEFLEPGTNCLAFPPGDAEGLVVALRRLAGDPALRRSLAGAGRLTAAELGADRLAAVLEEWHRAAIGGPEGSRPSDRPPLYGPRIAE